MTTSLRWDIFCRVVDNFGDAGVCWRLARQLAREHGLAVTLWIDDVGEPRAVRPGPGAGGRRPGRRRRARAPLAARAAPAGGGGRRRHRGVRLRAAGRVRRRDDARAAPARVDRARVPVGGAVDRGVAPAAVAASAPAPDPLVLVPRIHAGHRRRAARTAPARAARCVSRRPGGPGARVARRGQRGIRTRIASPSSATTIPRCPRCSTAGPKATPRSPASSPRGWRARPSTAGPAATSPIPARRSCAAA